MAKINKLSKGRNDAIKFVDNYGSMILEAKRKVAEEEAKPELTKAKTKLKKFPFELHEEFINETTNNKKNITLQIFK